MTLIKKIDVKNHRSSRRRNTGQEMHLVPKTVVTPATSPSGREKAQAEFAKDFSGEHFSPGGTATAVVILTPEEDTQAGELPSVPRS